MAVLAAVFTANGSYQSGTAFVAGLQPAMALGAVVVGLGAMAAVALPGRVPSTGVHSQSLQGITEAPMATA